MNHVRIKHKGTGVGGNNDGRRPDLTGHAEELGVPPYSHVIQWLRDE